MVTIMRILAVSINIFYLLSLVTSTSWFHHGARESISSLAAGSSSSSSSPHAARLTHIANLRSKHRKVAQLQNDKEIVDPDDLDEMDVGSGVGSDSDVNVNEAAPSHFNKKINKIIRKLQLIAQLKNQHHYKHEVNRNEVNITISSQRRGNKTKPEQETPANATEIETPNPLSEQVFQQQVLPLMVYGVPSNTSSNTTKDEPTKIDLLVNSSVSSEAEEEPQKEAAENIQKIAKLEETNPGGLRGIGVYFAELFGTLVGLTYGAVLQLTSGGQSPIAATAEGL